MSVVQHTVTLPLSSISSVISLMTCQSTLMSVVHLLGDPISFGKKQYRFV